MQIKDFEKKIQKEIDPDLSVRTNPKADDIAGVYYKDVFIGVSVPPVEIKEDIDKGYTDGIGYPYKNIAMAENFIKGKLAKTKAAMESDPDLFVKE